VTNPLCFGYIHGGELSRNGGDHLAREGVKDVAILQVGALPDRLAAMESDRVQATVLALPAMYVAQKRGFNILADVAAHP
jgi:ABC-type sugar transport system substrate-binding protein